MRIFCCIYSVKSGHFTKSVKFPVDSQLPSLHLHFALSKLIHPKAKYRSNSNIHQSWLISAKTFYSGVIGLGILFWWSKYSKKYCSLSCGNVRIREFYEIWKIPSSVNFSKRIFCCIYSVKSGNFTKSVKFAVDSQLPSLHLHFA